MPRSVLIRRGGEAVLVPEARIPLEAELHEALTTHPELVPTADMGLGRTVVVGRETPLASGYADLVLLDESGRIALVEVKKEGNPDTRRVVAQLLDYASAMWGQTLDDFEQVVLNPFLTHEGVRDHVSLRGFLREAFPPLGTEGGAEGEAPDAENPVETAMETLANVLRRGWFTLVIAAPQIPSGVERALSYLNAQGLRVFGVEFGYFAEGDVEVLVPRLAVVPAAQDGPQPPPEFDRERFLARIPVEGRAFVANLLDGAVEHGGAVKGTRAGSASIVAFFGRTEKPMCLIEPTFLWMGDLSKSVPSEPIEAMHRLLDEAIPGRLRGKAIRYLTLTPAQQGGVAQAVFDGCRRFAELASPQSEPRV